MERPHIIILGAGYAGIRAAKTLLSQGEDLRLTLIDQGEAHWLMTNLHEAASGRVQPHFLEIPLAQVFRNQPIRLVRDRILALDLKAKTLTGEGGIHAFDHLIIASGARAFYSDVPGAREHSYPLDSMEAALAIRRRLASGIRQVVISGGGLTGVELAADLKTMQPELAVTLVEAGEILADLDPTARDYVRRRLDRMGVAILTGSRVTAVETKGAQIVDSTGETAFLPGLVIWTTGTRPDWNETVEDAARPDLDEFLRLKGYPDVWVAGDAGGSDWATVENSLQSASRAAENLLAGLRGEASRPYEPKVRGQMIALGPTDGFTTTRLPLRGWPAVVLKFLVDLFYLLRVGGIGSAVNYLNGHLVGAPHQRTLTGNLLNSRGQRLWLVPLRLYLGSLWLLEGFKKIIGPEQFAQADRLADYLTLGADSWLRPGNLNVPFAWLSSADGVTGATMGGTSGPIIEDLPFWYEALMRTVMPTPALAMFFQGILVWAEFTVGVALVLGLFTWLASALSMAMTVNFILSGVAGWQLIWILPASLALMAGAGQVLGIDGWLIPRIRRRLGIHPI